MQNIAPVAVLGQTPYQNLYPNGGNPVGTQIRIGKVSFTVVGLLNTIGAGAGGSNQDDVIYIPVTTAMIRMQGDTNQTINSMQVQAASKDDLSSIQNAMEALLRQRHRLTTSQADDFQILNLAQIQQTASSIIGILTAFLASVAGISLIVGGIGIMNIMLVSVTERTREIGVRMAIGASRQDILFQFLLEAVILSMLGALIGIVLGVGGAELISLLAHMEMPISVWSILVSVAFSAGVGVVFGYLPARKAAYLNPSEALGYE
jgi:putative ABC transport system permease protein